MRSSFPQQFSGDRRRHVLHLVRQGKDTVNELSQALGLTDNAVRAQLADLEKKKLLRKAGMRSGRRRPHVVYRLTNQAEKLFVTSADLVFARFIGVLKRRLPSPSTKKLFRATGRSLVASALKRKIQPKLCAQRVGMGVAALRSLGGAARAERADGSWIIQSAHCPLAAVVREHREACQIVEGALSSIIGTQVRQSCSYLPQPRCRFEIGAEKMTP